MLESKEITSPRAAVSTSAVHRVPGGRLAIEKWSAAAASSGPAVFARFLEQLQVSWDCCSAAVARIPRTGPVVVVANHPFGLVEGATLGALLGAVRPDVKFLANSMLSAAPGIEPHLIQVDPFGNAASSNWRGMRHAIEWLRGGGLLVTFPSGEVAALKLPNFEIAEPEWNERIARLIRITGATALPVFFHGVNSPAFHLAGLIDPRLRTALLPQELVNKRGRTIRVAMGRPIKVSALTRFATDREAMDYLRQRTYLLQSRLQSRPSASSASSPFRFQIQPPRAKIAAEVDAALLRAEAASLTPDDVLLETADYRVLMAPASRIPNTLREIGRLRELAFRKVGEGTGRSLDLDRFDRHYLHLWVSHKETAEISGAYRLCGTDTVKSASDLYTSTLFRFRPALLEHLNPALELGRSFVRPEQQKSYQALLLLWKGIGRYVARHPRYRLLFGPVSISREYSQASRALIVSYLEARRTELAREVSPRRQFRAGRSYGRGVALLAPLLKNLEELSEAVAELEVDGKGVPVLLRQYLQLGGSVLAFNVDRAFSGVVDGLVVVDLARLTAPVLEKYLGRDGAAAFQKTYPS